MQRGRLMQGGRFDMKTVFRGMGSHYKNSTVVTLFYFYDGNLFARKTVSTYSNGPLALLKWNWNGSAWNVVPLNVENTSD